MTGLILALLLARPATCGGDCERYAADMAQAFEDVAVASGVPVDLLVAVAWVESTLDESNHGRLGRGLMGLHPSSPQHTYATVACDLDGARCKRWQIALGAGYLAHERRRCGGWLGALSSYGTGRCTGAAGERYAAIVRDAWAVTREALQ